VLTSLQNSLVKQIRKLHSAKERNKQQLFLLEGTHLLEEACAVSYPLVVLLNGKQHILTCGQLFVVSAIALKLLVQKFCQQWPQLSILMV
jgi:RNA methyltransferase, TrmH family